MICTDTRRLRSNYTASVNKDAKKQNALKWQNLARGYHDFRNTDVHLLKAD